jgi:hypothetical protein
MATIATLNVSVKANTDDYHKRMKKARSEVSDFAQGVRAAEGALAALGVGFSLAAAVEFVKGQYEANERVIKTAESIGIQADVLSQYQWAAQRAHVETETFNRGLLEFTNKLGAAREGGKDAIKDFDRLGITFNDLKNLSPEEVFKKAVDQLQAMPEEADRMTAAVGVFGKAGKEMASLFSESKTELHNAIEESKRLGLSMDQGMVKSMRQFEQSWLTVKGTTAGWANTLIAAMPYMLSPVRGGKDLSRYWDVAAPTMGPLDRTPKKNFEAARASAEQWKAARAIDDVYKDWKKDIDKAADSLMDLVLKEDAAAHKAKQDVFAQLYETWIDRKLSNVQMELEKEADSLLRSMGIDPDGNKSSAKDWNPGMSQAYDITAVNNGVAGKNGEQTVKDPAGMKLWERIARAVEKPHPVGAFAQ